MGGESSNSTGRLQDGCRDLLPERSAGHLGIEDVMNSHCLGGDRSARIDEQGCALVVQTPASVRFEHDILPSDLADVVRTVPGSFEVYDTNRNLFHRHGFP